MISRRCYRPRCGQTEDLCSRGNRPYEVHNVGWKAIRDSNSSGQATVSPLHSCTTTGLQLTPTPSTAFFLFSDRPLPVTPSDWPRIRMIQTFTYINTLAVSSQLFVLFKRHMKIEQSGPKRRHIKFRRRGVTKKKEYNIHNTAKAWNHVHVV
jgi:hypothetical protein